MGMGISVNMSTGVYVRVQGCEYMSVNKFV